MTHVRKLFLIVSLFFYYSPFVYSDQNELLNLSVEDLLNIEVISVSKKAKSLNDSPAAIFVITQDDIKRIGATSVPEALRLAPGVDVARIDSNKWAISARGFNGRFSNKLLVLIDGRNTYTRLFGGVFWENQDLMLEDVDRIEVIRGPGATLWGANAVNGVINIITKHSAETQGGLLVAGGGTEEQGFGAFRYGGQLNTYTTARAYIKGFKRDGNTHKLDGEDAGDNWDKVQGGFRMDSQLSTKDNLTIQGDAYHSEINQKTALPQLSFPYTSTFNEKINAFGGNLLTRYQHNFSSTSGYSLQAYYDFYHRDETATKESRHVADIDFQHHFSLFDWNDIVWGARYRYTHDETQVFDPSNLTSITPNSRNDQLFSAFVQNEITLIDDTLWLTLGSKFEHNDYSGFEIQPTARLMWIPHHKHRLWAAVSRAVRTPSRIEHNVNALGQVIPASLGNPPIVISLQGTTQFNSERTLSYELGYRTTLIDDLSIDITAFYTKYKDLISLKSNTPFFNSQIGAIEQSTSFVNNAESQTYGFEIASVWQILDWWRIDASYSLLKTDFFDSLGQMNDRSPQQHVSMHSSMSLGQNIDADILFRYVDESRAVGIPGVTYINDYISMDIRLAWRPSSEIEISLVGQNLLANHHSEYKQEIFTSQTELDRGMYGKITWQF